MDLSRITSGSHLTRMSVSWVTSRIPYYEGTLSTHIHYVTGYLGYYLYSINLYIIINIAKILLLVTNLLLWYLGKRCFIIHVPK